MKQPREKTQFAGSESKSNSNSATQHRIEAAMRQHITRSGRYVPRAESYKSDDFVSVIHQKIKWSKKHAVQLIFNQLRQANCFQFITTASIIVAVFILLTEADERREKVIYEAWKVLNSAKNEQSGAIVLTLERLNKEKHSLSGMSFYLLLSLLFS